MLPQKCTICGTTQGTFVDFQLDLEFYGTVYFCITNCFTQLANELGYRSPAQHHVLLESNTGLRTDLVEAYEKIERLENAVAALRFLDRSYSGSGTVVMAEGQATDNVDSQSDRDEQESPRQVTEQGSSDLLDNDSLNELI